MTRSIPASAGYRLAVVVAWILAGFLAVPVFVTVPSSFTGQDYLSLPKAGAWSLVQYQNFLEPSRRWLTSIGNSVLIALATATLATLLGGAAAIGIWRLANRWSELALMLVVMPIVAPVIALALGMFWVFTRIGLFDTYAGVIIAHVVSGVPFVVVTVLASLSQVDRTLERAALSLGASPLRFWIEVLVPAIRPGLLSGAALAFIFSWDELILTLFVAGRDITTLPRRMWEALQRSSDPVVAVAATIMILLTLAGILLSLWRQDRTR